MKKAKTRRLAKREKKIIKAKIKAKGTITCTYTEYYTPGTVENIEHNLSTIIYTKGRENDTSYKPL